MLIELKDLFWFTNSEWRKLKQKDVVEALDLEQLETWKMLIKEAENNHD